jgi:hypothetical protein
MLVTLCSILPPQQTATILACLKEDEANAGRQSRAEAESLLAFRH